ncbi:MAG: hypothetical protein HQL88_02260 [Magnetococcales bacterium]|nr:hypothetical protein [Magnetococcales bacterium]
MDFAFCLHIVVACNNFDDPTNHRLYKCSHESACNFQKLAIKRKNHSMRNLIIALTASAALLFASAPLSLNAASSGQWNSGGFTQWHASDGRTPLGSVGTQCFFCKPDTTAPVSTSTTSAAPSSPHASASYPAAQSPVRQAVATQKANHPVIKKAVKKNPVKKKVGKKKVNKKNSVKKSAAAYR